jgi:hypothetical protein
MLRLALAAFAVADAARARLGAVPISSSNVAARFGRENYGDGLQS